MVSLKRNQERNGGIDFGMMWRKERMGSRGSIMHCHLYLYAQNACHGPEVRVKMLVTDVVILTDSFHPGKYE